MAIAVLVAAFQNCTNVQTNFFSDSKASSTTAANVPNGGNGNPYQGILFVQAGNCSADSIKSKIIYYPEISAAFLVRQNCMDLATPIQLAGAEYSYQSGANPTITYLSEVYSQGLNQIAVVQSSSSWKNDTTFFTSYSFQPFNNAPTTSGNFIVCEMSYPADPYRSTSIARITDDAGNVFKPASAPAYSGIAPTPGYNWSMVAGEMWYAENIKGHANSTLNVEWNITPNTNIDTFYIKCAEYFGVAKSGALSTSIVSNGAAATASASIGTLTSRQPNELVVAALWGEIALNSTAGWTQRFAGINEFAEMIRSSSSTFTTYINSTSDWFTILASFKSE